MPLPFCLKIAWFCLSLSGLISCWATMLAFGHALGAYELPVLYAIGCTLLQGSFCLGMIWKMDPLQMPRAFCIAQSTFIGFGAFLGTGVAASLSIGTSLTVLKPKTWGDQGKSTIAWRHQYLPLVVVFPLVASAVQLAVTLHYDWPVHREDDFHCDYSGGLTWLRLLSYSGPPLLLFIPCFLLSILSIIHILKVYQHLRRARDSDMVIDTVLPRRPKNKYVARVISTPPPSTQPPIRRQPLSSTLNSPNLAARKFHMPFSPPSMSLDDQNLNSSVSSSATDPPESPVSSSFPTFANPAEGGTISIDPDGVSTTGNFSHPNEDWRDILDATHSLPDKSVKDGSYHWHEDDKSDFEYGKYVEHDDEYYNSGGSRLSGTMAARKLRRPPPSLAPAIWRMILFQFGLTAIQVLSCITSWIAVIAHRPPTAFGTQHIALLLAAWGPVIVFGHLPAVRKTFLTWLPWKSRNT